jgi:beta-glucosidase
LAIAITGLGTFFTKETNAVKLEGNDSIAQSVAEEGIVLLKNENNCLPFNSSTKVGLYGSGQNENYVTGGLGSGWVNTDVINKPIDSFKDAANKGYIHSASTMHTPNQTGFNRVIYFIYRNSTEGGDRTATEGDYYLSKQEKSDISALVKAYPGKVCVVLNVAGIIDTTWLNNNGVSSIVLLWLGGSMGSVALANLMTGRVTPSGKVADTWANDYND